MKKAFTLLELVFVIVVIGVLATVIISRREDNSLQEAAAQLLSHIRYTQHLALSDNMYRDKDKNYYKRRWQIKFSKVGGSDNKWAYAIFHDQNADGNPNASETAINPADNTKKLTGGYSGTIEYSEIEATPTLNLGYAYGIKDIDFKDCNVNNNDGKKRIFFDSLGRPLSNNPKNLKSTFKYSHKSALLNKTCKIILCNIDDCSTASEKQKITIVIYKESGYSEIL